MLIIIIALTVNLYADVVLCKGVASIEVSNGVIQKKEDASTLRMQLNTTKDKAIMILNKKIFQSTFTTSFTTSFIIFANID